MTRDRFVCMLRDAVMIGDGAIGTELMARGFDPAGSMELENLLHPDIVGDVHRSYVAAGSRIIETNTFAANPIYLDRAGAAHRLHDILRAGVRLARDAAGQDVLVAGAVGPLPPVEGVPLEPVETTRIFGDIAAVLLDAGADILLFETFGDLDQLAQAVSVARAIGDVPVVAQMAFETGGRSAGGDAAPSVYNRCIEAGADVVGANCGAGVSSVVSALAAMPHGDRPLSAYLNAGFAEQVDGRRIFRTSTAYLVEHVLHAAGHGARLVGGCCGTSPETIRKFVRAFAEHAVAPSSVYAAPISAPFMTVIPREAPPCAEPSAGPVLPPPILVELDPPKRPDLSGLAESAALLRRAGVRGITLADNPLASVRVDILAAASRILAAGMQVIPHLTGRDRNRIALQSTILGAHALGIRSIVCVTGDPVRLYHEANTSGVFDVTSIGLVSLLAEWNSGRRIEGVRTSFAIGVALNPNVRSIDGQVDKLRRKVDAGAHFALTQPIYDRERLDILQNALARAGMTIPYHVGILPLLSSRMAAYLHNEVPGIVIPASLRALLERYENPSDQRKAGIEAAVVFVESIRDRVDRLFLIPPRNSVDAVLPVLATVHVTDLQTEDTHTKNWGTA